MTHAENSKKTTRTVGRPFVMGVSGNAGGRPKLESGVRELAQAHTIDAMQRLLELAQSEDERVALAAIKYILDRAWGTPRQTVEVATFNADTFNDDDAKILADYTLSTASSIKSEPYGRLQTTNHST